MKYLFTMMSGLSFCSLFAQLPADTLQLKEVKVSATRLHLPLTGTSLDTIDSKIQRLYTASGIAELIASSGKVFVKSYGPGTLSSFSLNGTNATQTNILWNGFKIESPMLGQPDASLFPSFFADEIIIQSGGRSDSWGSGSMGGSILLNNLPAYDSGMSVTAQASLASYNEEYFASRIGYGNKKYSGTVAWFSHESKNNYHYLDFFGKEQSRENASYSGQGLLSNQYLISGAHTFALNIWLQKNYRDLPASVTEAPSHSTQQDKSARAVASWKYTCGKFITEVRTGVNNEQLIYKKTEADSSDFITSASHAESRCLLNGNQFIIGADYEYSKAHEHFYSVVPEQHLAAALASWKREFENLKLNASINVRKEWFNGKENPLVPSLGLEKKLPLQLLLFFSAARIYRNTTLNERYWTPGGNPDLKPESGWSYNASLHHSFEHRLVSSKASVEYFDNRIINQILWMGSSYYSPVNVLEVHSFGFTLMEKAEAKIRSFNFSLSGTYTYTKSINTKVAANQQTSLDKQTIYVPVHQAGGYFFAAYKRFIVSFNQYFTGPYYTQSDNLDSLPSHSIADAGVSYRMPVKKFAAEIQFRVKNIFNTDYNVISYFPMPLRSYLLTLILKFNSKKNNL
jgi:vitamin B12 transporter